MHRRPHLRLRLTHPPTRLPACVTNDHGHLKCETSGGSPLAADCETAIDNLAASSTCHQSNHSGSHCTTLKKYGSCKIDVCGRPGAALVPEYYNEESRCKEYLRFLLADCGGKGGGAVVGGQIFPQTCGVDYGHGGPVDDPQYTDPAHYRLQFAHS